MMLSDIQRDWPAILPDRIPDNAVLALLSEDPVEMAGEHMDTLIRAGVLVMTSDDPGTRLPVLTVGGEALIRLLGAAFDAGKSEG